VHEGLKFELRCKPVSNAGHPLIARFCSCVGDLAKVKQIIEALKQLRITTETANNTLATDSTNFTEQNIQTLGEGVQDLKKILAESTRERDGAIRSTPEPVERPAQIGRTVIRRDLIRRASEVALLVNRFMALPPDRQRVLLGTEGLDKGLADAQTAIEQVRQILVDYSKSPFEDIRDWLLDQLNNSPFLTDCKLRGRVSSMVLPSFGQQIGARGAQTLVSANRPLLEASLEYLRDCICRALNPACQPCEDSAVLLACLEVEECDVVRICNMERRFVLSPAAVRYWLPPLQLLGNIAEKLCCDPVESLLDMIPDGETKGRDFETLLKHEITRMLRDSLCSPSDIKLLTDLVSDIGIESQSDAAQKISTEAAAAIPRRGGRRGRPN
jgi:hypothetical protein